MSAGTFLIILAIAVLSCAGLHGTERPGWQSFWGGILLADVLFIAVLAALELHAMPA